MSSNTLTVLAADETAEIAVLDGGLRSVAKGIGKVQQSLPAGLYKVRVRVGPTLVEQLVSLDQDRQIAFPQASIPSPIPLERTSRGNTDHTTAAIKASQTARDVFGAGASVLIFAREQSRSGSEPRHKHNPATGLSLLTESGQELANVEQRAEVNLDGDPCAGWRADIDPGPYRLRLARKDGSTLERALFAGPHAQIQIFLLQCDYLLPDGGLQRIPDMSGSAIAISPSHQFSPQSRRTRLAEIARYALTQSRRILSDGLLRELLDEKFDDPMLGLLGAHLLLRDKPADAPLFRIVTDNLLRLLGPDHPDLRALWRRRQPADSTVDSRLESPPMLRLSWDLAVEASIRDPEVLGAEGPSSIAGKILPDAPWLIWRTTSGDRPSAVERALQDYLRARAHIGRVAAAPRNVFSRLSTAVTDLFTRRSSTAAPVSPDLDADERADLVRTLGVPDQLLKSMLDRLSR
jgi:hypothetical protein